MIGKSAIEWTDATWNPLTGCSLVSEGCRNCYAAREAAGRLLDGRTWNEFPGHKPTTKEGSQP